MWVFFRLEGLGAAGFFYPAGISKLPSVDKNPQPFEPRPLTQDWRSGLQPARKCRRLYRTFISVMRSSSNLNLTIQHLPCGLSPVFADFRMLKLRSKLACATMRPRVP